MANTKYTPGPLTVDATVFRGKNDNQYTIKSNYSNRPKGVDFMDAYVNISGYYGTYGPHVFAEAPKLLEALELTLNFIENTESELGIELTCGVYAREVIAKAKGQTT